MWCPKCEEYTVDLRFHQCPPTWLVRLPSYHDDGFDEVLADNAEQAAQKFAEQYDQGGDYNVVGGSPIDVFVSGPNGEDEKKFHVEGEAVATNQDPLDVDLRWWPKDKVFCEYVLK